MGSAFPTALLVTSHAIVTYGFRRAALVPLRFIAIGDPAQVLRGSLTIFRLRFDFGERASQWRSEPGFFARRIVAAPSRNLAHPNVDT
jgi:hypothetical protein